ncbi:MAG: hypothetical protein CK425_05600 [Parachlamydia sp.]|jgi:hypothetical protein|nr:MAG: hypothetical protein CK425_05600 [Parachlamydia sp.]
MNKLTKLDQYFKKYMKELNHWLPDGVVQVDLALLAEFELLDSFFDEKSTPALTRYFHVVESFEKITLINDQFVIWIVPEKAEIPRTLILIALNYPDHLDLEIAFMTKGVYNTSRLVLRILEKFLFEIQENEELLKRMGSEKPPEEPIV